MSDITEYNPPRDTALKDIKRFHVKAHGYSSADVLKENKDALWALGCEYELKNRYPQAMYWYKISATKNFAKAENSIGMLYNYGKGVRPDYSLAMVWYIKAARKYNQDAFANVAKLLEMGYGISENKYMALEWFSKYHKDSFHVKRIEEQGFFLDTREKEKSNDELIRELEEYIEYESLRKMAENRPPLPRTQSRLQQLEMKLKPQKKDQPLKTLFEKQLQANSEKINRFESSFQALQTMAETSQTKIASLKQANQTLKHEKHELENQIQLLLEREKTFEKKIKKQDDKIKSLRLGGKKQHVASMKQAQHLESILKIKQTMELEKKILEHENEVQGQKIRALEQQLKAKEVEMDLATLTRETHGVNPVECINGMLKTFEALLQSRTRENDLVKQNMQFLLEEEKKKNRVLEKQVKFMQQKTEKRDDVDRYDYDIDSIYDVISDNEKDDSDDNINDINYDTPNEDSS